MKSRPGRRAFYSSPAEHLLTRGLDVAVDGKIARFKLRRAMSAIFSAEDIDRVLNELNIQPVESRSTGTVYSAEDFAKALQPILDSKFQASPPPTPAGDKVW